MAGKRDGRGGRVLPPARRPAAGSDRASVSLPDASPEAGPAPVPPSEGPGPFRPAAPPDEPGAGSTEPATPPLPEASTDRAPTGP